MASKKNIGFAQLRVGLLVLLAGGITLAIILTISGDIGFFKNTITIRTKLPQVDGLRQGTEVRLAGVYIGQVSDVILLPIAEDDKQKIQSVEIVMKINSIINGVSAKERIREDSVVKLGSIGLLGDKVIDITPGTKTNKAIEENALVKGDQEASLPQVVSSTSNILQDIDELADQVKSIAKNINEGKGNLGLIIRDEKLYNNANATILESQKLVERIRDGGGTVGKLLNDPSLYDQIQTTTKKAETLIADISAGKGTIGKIATDDEIYNRTNKILERLDTIAAKIETTADKIDHGQGTVSQLLNNDSLYKETQNTISNLNHLTVRIDKTLDSKGSVNRLLEDPTLYNNVNEASAEVVKLLQDFRKEPKKYLTIKIRLF
ncbi:MAG: MCE family protein [Acidobacteria bacterium]|nr:MCE family protein [Acidobacteriota bacterium]